MSDNVLAKWPCLGESPTLNRVQDTAGSVYTGYWREAQRTVLYTQDENQQYAKGWKLYSQPQDIFEQDRISKLSSSGQEKLFLGNR